MVDRESHGKSGVQPVREKRSNESIERELDEVVARLRDSDIDIRDYMPDMDAIRREARPERRAEKLRAALELERDVTLRQSLSEIATLRAEPNPVRVEQRLHEVIAKAKASDVELGEYFPDLETIVREVDPVRRAKKLRNAIDNPEIDEALTEARQSLARLDRATPNRGSVASPWAQPTPDVGGLDKAALPSALMPFAPAPDRTPETEHAATLDKAPTPAAARPSRRWTVAKSGMAVIAVVAPLALMYFLLVWQNDRGPKGTSPAATSVAVPAMPTPSATTPAPSVAPLPSAGPHVDAAASASAAPAPTTPPAPTAAVDATAARPAPSPTPLQPARVPGLPKTGPSAAPTAHVPPTPPDQDPGMNE
jgi:hypothetical protein